MKNDLIPKLKKIKLLVLDCDGILTNGEIIIDGMGKETKIFDVQDGFGVVLCRRNGIKTAIISARSAKAVDVRAKDLGFDKVVQNARPKTAAYEKMLKAFKLKDSEVCFMGDDLPDLGVLKRAGLAITVPNARREAKLVADYVTEKEGGKGAVREVAEMILKAQNKWKKIVESY